MKHPAGKDTLILYEPQPYPQAVNLQGILLESVVGLLPVSNSSVGPVYHQLPRDPHSEALDQSQ